MCVDFTKVDPSKDGKENILVLTDAFTKFSQAFVTPNHLYFFAGISFFLSQLPLFLFFTWGLVSGWVGLDWSDWG